MREISSMAAVVAPLENSKPANPRLPLSAPLSPDPVTASNPLPIDWSFNVAGPTPGIVSTASSVDLSTEDRNDAILRHRLPRLLCLPQSHLKRSLFSGEIDDLQSSCTIRRPHRRSRSKPTCGCCGWGRHQ
ncbi:hypothetical protein ACFX13_006519 [Malus domestica]